MTASVMRAVSGSGAAGGFDPTVFQDFGDIFGDFFGFGDIFGGGSPASAAALNAAPICAKTSPWNSKKRYSARKRRSRFAATRLVKSATVRCRAGQSSGRRAAPAVGRGQVRYQQGFFSIARTCPTCQGAGSVDH